MPVLSDGHGRYASVDTSDLYSEHPKDFLDHATYEARVATARHIVLNVILHLRKGRPLNDAVYLDGGESVDLANFIDGLDGSRSRRVRKQGKRSRQFTSSYWIRSPQDIKKRRRRLFSLDDIPVLLHSEWFHDEYKLLDVMRWHLIHDAILRMVHEGDIWYMNGIWQVRVSIMDQHRGCGHHPSQHGKKYDRRPFHGRPNRDRKLGFIAA